MDLTMPFTQGLSANMAAALDTIAFSEIGPNSSAPVTMAITSSSGQHLPDHSCSRPMLHIRTSLTPCLIVPRPEDTRSCSGSGWRTSRSYD